jgi:hypothetical protein
MKPKSLDPLQETKIWATLASHWWMCPRYYVNQFVFVERHRESLILLLRKGDKILFLIG